MTAVSWSHKVLPWMLAPDESGVWSLYRTQCAQAGTLDDCSIGVLLEASHCSLKHTTKPYALPD